MSLVQLTYISVARRPMAENDLLQILEKSRDNNLHYDITGMLLFRDSYFIQALEGEQRIVRDLFQRIAADERHHHVLEIGTDEINARDFDNWSMGFNYANNTQVNFSQVEGFTDCMTREITYEFLAEESRAKTLLKLFKMRSTF